MNDQLSFVKLQLEKEIETLEHGLGRLLLQNERNAFEVAFLAGYGAGVQAVSDKVKGILKSPVQ